jgi:hypothetical protein
MTDNPNGRQKKQDRPRKTDRQTNALNGKERFALWTALKEAKGELEAERADMVKAAAMMTQRLGFKVTNHNIKDAINQGIVNWKRPSRTLVFRSAKRFISSAVDAEAAR